jgi:hypothetical protein
MFPHGRLRNTHTVQATRYFIDCCRVGPYRLGDVAQILGIKPGRLSPVRASLIGKGMVYSPEHGLLAFTVPLFDEFMRRAMQFQAWAGAPINGD